MLLISTVLVFLLGFASGQGCDRPTYPELETLITDNLEAAGNPADVTTTLLYSRLVCLASASTENKYQFVSVVAQYTRVDDGGAPYTETGQYEFECVSSTWMVSTSVLGSDTGENREVPVDASRLIATERTDCFLCIKPGHPTLSTIFQSPFPVPDEVHHCLACSGCDDPQLCYLEPDFPAEPVCCNFYDEAGMCFPECPASTVTNGKECLTECPAGLYNVSGVCENCVISCENGGTLLNDPNTCECQCESIYGGTDCSECRCQNGGTCGGNREQCDCPSGYSGVICETCSRECQNGGTLNSDECSCICVEGFAGDNCEIACDQSCQNGGTQEASSCECSCPAGFFGSYCENKDCSSLTDNCMECSGTPLTCTACEDGYNIIADRDDGEPRCGRETGSNLSAGAIAGIVIGLLVLIPVMVVLSILAVALTQGWGWGRGCQRR